MTWTIAGVPLSSRFILGTARYPSPETVIAAIHAAGAEVVTVSLRRQLAADPAQANAFWELLRSTGCRFLPNTAGCYRADEAVVTARIAREVFETTWIKLEVIGDDYNLQPDPFGTVEAAKELIKDGFDVFAYCTDDLVFCQRLVEAGCRVLMPWAAPIGSGRGLINPYALRTLRERLPEVTMLVDAGIGSPSHAAAAMEMGYDGILLNSAVAHSPDPVRMAEAFKLAIQSGRIAFEAGVMEPQQRAVPTTPVVGVPFWQQVPVGK